MSQIQALIGEKLGSYRIESILGSGAMGVVYRGTDEKRGRPAAIKVVSGEIAHGGKVQRRFEREAEILQQFRHPNIVRFLAWGKFRGTWYIAMEFIQGATLEKLLHESGPIPWREAVNLAIQVCDALSYAHERGVVHRDLKPSNLMITEDRRVKLTDFGIAKDLDRTSLTATGRTLGTAAYMSPEQIRGTPAVSHKTDLYAMGAVLYQMLVGRAPFEGSSPVVLMHCHLNEPAPRPSAKVHEIPRALDDLVVAMMAKAPADRPWDAVAVGMVLTELRDKAARGEPIPMVWPSTGSDANPPRGGGGAEPMAPATRSRKKTRKATILSTLTGSFLTSRGRAARDGTDEPERSRAAVETLVLLAALLGIGGLIVYLIWPAGQESLYKRAEALMASSRYADWVTARDECIEPLNRKFPDNPHHEQTTAWLDKILLHDANSRAGYLNRYPEVDSPITRPNTEAERKYVLAYAVAGPASRRGDDLAALKQWKDLASVLTADDKEERQWYLLALANAKRLEATISDRRQFVETQLQLAAEAFGAGRSDDGRAILLKLKEEYSRFTDLADLFREDTKSPAAGPAKPGSPARPPSPPPGPGGAVPEKTAPESGKSAAPPADRPPGAAGPTGKAPALTPEPQARSGPAATDAGAASDARQPRLLREVNQQFDSEFRRM